MKDDNDSKKHPPEEKALAAAGFIAGMPTNPHAMHFLENTPEGLALVQTAPSAAEADLIRQVLTDAGFHPQYVPSEVMGAFGVPGSSLVHVLAEEAEEAKRFLEQYFNSPLEEIDENFDPGPDPEL